MPDAPLSTYKKNSNLRRVSLCLLAERGGLILGMKKRRFGAGKWNGFGGKPAEGETIEQAAVRETEEEAGVTPTSMEKVAVLDFYFAGDDKDRDWNQRVVVFWVTGWKGAPRESEEMLPRWFAFDKLPYGEMWEDDSHWLPQVISGRKVRGYFLFDENQKMKEYELGDLPA